jgi:hypothetical protein
VIISPKSTPHDLHQHNHVAMGSHAGTAPTDGGRIGTAIARDTVISPRTSPLVPPAIISCTVKTS